MRWLYLLAGVLLPAVCLVGSICYLILSVDVASPVKTDLILPLSMSEDRLLKALELVENGYSDTILVTTAGAYSQLKVNLQNGAVEVLYPGDARSTFEEALLLKEVTQLLEIKSVMVVSDFVHLYRARWSISRVLGDKDVAVFFLAAGRHEHTPVKMLAQEIPKMLYYWLWYGLLGRTTHQEWTETVKEFYSGVMDRYF